MAELLLKRLGLCHIKDALALQDECTKDLSKGVDSLISARHYSVITYTKKAQPENLPQIERCLVDRGGGVMLHTQEQLTFYSILNLKHHKEDLNWYINTLEEVIILALGELMIHAKRSERGIVVNDGALIATLGIKIKNWCSSFGFTVNVEPNPLYNYFGEGVLTTVKEVLPETQDLSYLMLEGLITKHFISLFGYSSCM